MTSAGVSARPNVRERERGIDDGLSSRLCTGLCRGCEEARPPPAVVDDRTPLRTSKCATFQHPNAHAPSSGGQ